MAYADYAHCIACDRKVVYTEDGAMSPAGGFYDELRSVYCKECGDDLKRQLAAANEHIHTLMVDKDKLFDQAQEMLHDRDKQLAAANERAGRLEAERDALLTRLAHASGEPGPDECR